MVGYFLILAVVSVVSVAVGFFGRKAFVEWKKGTIKKGTRSYFLKQLNPLVEEGLVRELLANEEVSVCSINESMSVAFVYSSVNPRGLNVGMRLKGGELHELMELPTAEKVRQLGQIANMNGEQRAFAFEEQTVETMRMVKGFKDIES